MSIIRWNPVRDVTAWHPASDIATELVNMQGEVDRVFARFFRGGALDDRTTSTWLPAVDIVEHENEYTVTAELPGIDKDDVKINVANSVLTIKGEKKGATESTGKNFHRLERNYGTFLRSFTLPNSVKSEKIEASFRDGILTILLPKIEEAKPKEIEVKVK